MNNATTETPVEGAGQDLRTEIERLRKSEERFRHVIEAAPNAMVMVDDSGMIDMVNAQTEIIFGYRRSELLGQPVEMLVPKRFRAHHPALRTAFLLAPTSRPMGAGRDLFGLRRDGTEFPMQIGLNPITTDAGTMVLSAIVDISDRKQKEENIRAVLREKDILLGEVHHRVKNNLQIVYSLLDLQSARIADPRVLAMLRDTQNRVRSMALIHQTLYRSRDFTGVDFSTFLESLCPMLVASYSINPDLITLSIDTVEVKLPINTAIPCGLIVNELISNCLKHAFSDGRRGQIKISLVRDTNDDVALSVSDNGIGVPSELNVEDAATLGLQLVTTLTEQLGGRLTIQRADPTCFVLRFPLER